MYDPATGTLGQVGDITAFNKAFGKEAFLVVRSLIKGRLVT